MRPLFTILFYFILTNSFSQDTLYSVRYPNGIVTDSFTYKHKRYHFYPIKSPNRRTVIPEKTLSKIHYSDGEVYLNEKINANDYFYLNTNSLTGDIEYVNKIPLSGLKTDLRLNLTDSLNSKAIEFHSLYRSENSAIYQGRFKTKFAGDIHLTYFKLSFKNVNDKLIIRANDLKSTYTDSIKYRWEVMDTLNYETFKPLFDISRVYSLSRRYEDKKTYWEPIDFYLKSIIWKSSNYFNKNESKISQPQKIDSLPVFRNLLYIEGITGYSNYFDKNEKNKPETANKNLISIGFQFSAKWNFGRNTNHKFGLNLHIASVEMFIGDKNPGISFTIGEVGPCFTKKINPKSTIDLGLSFGLSSYLRVGSGSIGPSVTGNPALKSSFEFKYRFQKFVTGIQLNNRYPINMNSISLLIGYSFN